MRKGKLLKQFTASEIRLTQGIWTVYRFFMENLQDGHSTELIMNAMYYNTGVLDEYFNNSNLPMAAEMDFDIEASE